MENSEQLRPAEGADEREALAALRRRDSRGLETLARLHEVRAVRLAYAILADRAAAEDVASTSFVKVFDHVHQYDERRPFSPWFDRIVVNEARKALRRRRFEIRLGASRRESALIDESSAIDHAIANEQQRVVLSAIRTLPDLERVAVALRYYLEMNEREMCEALGWPAGTVKRRLFNARRRLRDRLAVLVDNESTHRKEELECLSQIRESTTS
jgi:RNA polymerase sigma factor (sigma-70 family)